MRNRWTLGENVYLSLSLRYLGLYSGCKYSQIFKIFVLLFEYEIHRFFVSKEWEPLTHWGSFDPNWNLNYSWSVFSWEVFWLPAGFVSQCLSTKGFKVHVLDPHLGNWVTNIELEVFEDMFRLSGHRVLSVSELQGWSPEYLNPYTGYEVSEILGCLS